MGKAVTPSEGNVFLFRTLCTLEGPFKLIWRPARELDSPRALLPELQRYKDKDRGGALGAEVSGYCH